MANGKLERPHFVGKLIISGNFPIVHHKWLDGRCLRSASLLHMRRKSKSPHNRDVSKLHRSFVIMMVHGAPNRVAPMQLCPTPGETGDTYFPCRWSSMANSSTLPRPSRARSVGENDYIDDSPWWLRMANYSLFHRRNCAQYMEETYTRTTATGPDTRARRRYWWTPKLGYYSQLFHIQSALVSTVLLLICIDNGAKNK